MDKHFIQVKLILSPSFSELFGNLLVENGCKGYIIEEDKKNRIILKGYLEERSKAKALVEKIYKYTESLKKLNKKSLQIGVELKRIKEEGWVCFVAKRFEGEKR